MAFPVRVTFRNLAHSDALETTIRDHAKQLEMFSSDILDCHVVVSLPHQHHASGNHSHIDIELTLPGEQLLVNHDPSTYRSLRDIEEVAFTKSTEPDLTRDPYVAVDRAFDAARRRLQDKTRRRRGDVKTHRAQ